MAGNRGEYRECLFRNPRETAGETEGERKNQCGWPSPMTTRACAAVLGKPPRQQRLVGGADSAPFYYNQKSWIRLLRHQSCRPFA